MPSATSDFSMAAATCAVTSKSCARRCVCTSKLTQATKVRLLRRAPYHWLAVITRAICRVLVGREEELSILEDALLAACRGDGSVVLLSGDAGMGKSRLCGELAVLVGNTGATVMEGSCSE